jgi:predicted short-subunit dehydrogenase-like oxidoreductase (DUF2520 family)
VFVLGAGRAGSALAAALQQSGVPVVGLHGRRSLSSSVVPVSSGPLPPSLREADIVLVTVRDSQLDAALSELLQARLKDGATILHASGSAEPESVEELRRRGYPSGTFHPLVPLAAGSDGSGALRGAWIGTDGDDRARAAAEELAAALGAHVMSIPAGQKASYHAAAVMASNFPCVLAYLARQLLASSGVPAAQASAAVVSLMHASVENLRGRDPAAALTGPVVRGDAGTVRSHVQAISAGQDEHTMAVYRALTAVAVEMVRRSAGESAALREIEEVLARG